MILCVSWEVFLVLAVSAHMCPPMHLWSAGGWLGTAGSRMVSVTCLKVDWPFFLRLPSCVPGFSPFSSCSGLVPMVVSGFWAQQERKPPCTVTAQVSVHPLLFSPLASVLLPKASHTANPDSGMEIGFHHLVVGEVFVPSFAVHHTDFEEILYSCLEFPVDREAWWATVHRVTQSQTRLKRLSMHACIGEGNGNPLQCSCLENPRDRGAGWAAVYGAAQSRTQLKRLSSNSSSTLICC